MAPRLRSARPDVRNAEYEARESDGFAWPQRDGVVPSASRERADAQRHAPHPRARHRSPTRRRRSRRARSTRPILTQGTLKTRQAWVQGYNAQAATNERHIVIAAELTNFSADFGQLEPMVDAAPP